MWRTLGYNYIADSLGEVLLQIQLWERFLYVDILDSVTGCCYKGET